MTLADDMREFSERMENKNNKAEFESRMKQLHKMIKESASQGKHHLKVHENFFKGPNKQKVIDQLISDGFFVCPPPLLSNTVRGINNNEWTIDWNKEE